jgi:hypothetical protein
MPGSMDGLELARYVRRHWPRVAVLIASGNSKPALTELARRKPVLAQAVQYQPAARRRPRACRYRHRSSCCPAPRMHDMVNKVQLRDDGRR